MQRVCGNSKLCLAVFESDIDKKKKVSHPTTIRGQSSFLSFDVPIYFMAP